MQRYADYHELFNKHPEYSSLIAEEKKGDTSNESSIERSHIRRQFSSSSTRVTFSNTFSLTFGLFHLYLTLFKMLCHVKCENRFNSYNLILLA
jgi:hypothetical protein